MSQVYRMNEFFTINVKYTHPLRQHKFTGVCVYTTLGQGTTWVMDAELTECTHARTHVYAYLCTHTFDKFSTMHIQTKV